MTHSVCSNPTCKKTYNVDDIKADDGYCSDECWEKINCLEPVHAKFEKIEITV